MENIDELLTPESPQAKPQAKPNNDTPSQQPEPAAPQTSMPTVPFGTYAGPENGIGGTITVTKSYTLDLRNASHQTIQLEPGDVITSTKFKDGELVGGCWQRDGQTKFFNR